MTYTFDILRPDDLLALTVDADNLRLDTSVAGRPRLRRIDATLDAHLTFHFAPQSIAEQATFEAAQIASVPFNPPASATPPPPTPPPLPGSTAQRMSSASRLVFRLKPKVNAIDYRIAALLDWSALELLLPPAAQVLPGAATLPGTSQAPAVAEPALLETALELPYRLWIAPNVPAAGSVAAWLHASDPVTHAGRAELWHTRLASARKVTGANGAARTNNVEASDQHTVPLRVVWSPDFVGAGPLPPHSDDDAPFLSALSARDRDQIVILGAGFTGYTITTAAGVAKPYVPATIDASRLFLSALGGWLSSNGKWPFPVSYTYSPITQIPPELRLKLPTRPITPIAPTQPGKLPMLTAALDLVAWNHVATQGRDHYVRVVYEGFLYPFGHSASLIKVTERKVLAPHGAAGNPSDSPLAGMRQKMYVVVRERDRTYPAIAFQSHGREMPFAPLVQINTTVTPDIDQPTWIGNASFRIEVGGKPFMFHVTTRDSTGSTIPFLAPLIFVSLSEDQITAVRNAYLGDNDLRRCDVRGQQIAYADPSAGDTVLKTSALYFDAQLSGAKPPYLAPPFVPALDRAAVSVPALQQLTGSSNAVLIKWYQDYLDAGLDPNAGVFVEVDGVPSPVAFSADKAGGFARPNLGLTALSARKGAVSGKPANAAEGSMDPAAYFGDIDAKLFGTIDLGQLIPLDKITHLASGAQNTPEIRTHSLPNRKHPKQLRTVIAWEPQLQDYTASFVSILFNSDGQTSALKLHVRIVDRLDGTPPQSSATGVLSNFELLLAKVLQLKVASIDFSSQNGAKSIVQLHLASSNAITFVGPLEFIQTLADILPPGLFGSSGPSINFTPSALSVSYTLGLPPITCGVFSLQHISITAGLDLPYLDGKPAVEFAFAKRNNPFLITVEIFGGGGFVHLVLDTQGVQMVEGALEFGGNYALDLGVASGAVHAMAGIYFQLKSQYSDLTGFVDIGGEVSVLGIISISIDLYLSLSWQSSPSGNVIQGRATLTIAVHILFFSASVQLSVERSFKAGGGDPKVFQLMSAQQWSDYAQSFG